MYPHFLCIGAQKSATSWLNKVLHTHPKIWPLPVKSTRYFNNPSTPAYKVALFGGQDKDRWRRLARNRLKKMLRHKNYKNLAWFYRFYFFERTDEWYASLFTPAADQIAGELTPAYAQLKRQTVSRIYDLMPETKIIYLLRNPVARTWSNTAMLIEKKYKQSMDEVDDHIIKKYILSEDVSRHSDYLKTLDLWGEYFGERQIHVAFFDQLVEDPKNFLKDIFRFLGVDDSDEYIPNTVGVKRYIGQYPTISDKYLELLASTYLPNLEKLHRRFNNQYTAQWLNTLTPHAKFLRGRNFGQFRLDEANQQFEAWMTHNPHKKFADYYAEKMMARLNKGKTHASLGRNLKGKCFEGSGDSILNKLIDEGLNPGHVCVDYGCGSLRVGYSLIKYLKAGNYWGYDVTDDFYKIGIELIPPEILQDKKPHLNIISNQTLSLLQKDYPDFIFSNAVALHVPPTDFDEYLRNILSITGPHTKAYIVIPFADKVTQYSKPSWAYPMRDVKEKIEYLGGLFEYMETKKTFQSDFVDTEITKAWVKITRFSS